MTVEPTPPAQGIGRLQWCDIQTIAVETTLCHDTNRKRCAARLATACRAKRSALVVGHTHVPDATHNLAGATGDTDAPTTLASPPCPTEPKPPPPPSPIPHHPGQARHVGSVSKPHRRNDPALLKMPAVHRWVAKPYTDATALQHSMVRQETCSGKCAESVAGL